MANQLALSPVVEGGKILVDSELENVEFVQPTPKLSRSTRLLRRISSTTSFDMSMLTSTIRPRKRKRRDADDDDNVSVQSLNILPEADNVSMTGKNKNKRRSLVKMSSLVNMLSPSTNKRTSSFKTPSGSPPSTSTQPSQRQITPYKKPKPAPSSDKRTNQFWSETVDQETRAAFTSQEIKRQEAIYELVHGEKDLIEDLKMVHELYYNSMKQLKLLSDEELDSIFGIVERLVPFHQDLLRCLTALRKSDGTTDNIGATFLQWVPHLKHYETYCANQLFAKGLLDHKKTDRKVADFLTRCLESPFSRKLDLWNFLDLPRSRLVKYPILLKQVYKYTSDDHPDKNTLSEVLLEVEAVIKEVDDRMGQSKCKQVVQSLEFIYDTQRTDLINQSTSVLCSGQLKNDRGTKLYVVLFDKVLVVTRQATRNNTLRYQVVKDPIPLANLDLTDLSESDNKKGSFRNKVLRNTSSDKCTFRISPRSTGYSHILHARDEHDKRQWLTCIQSAVDRAKVSETSVSSVKGLVSNDNSSNSLISEGESCLESSGELAVDTGCVSSTIIKQETVV